MKTVPKAPTEKISNDDGHKGDLHLMLEDVIKGLCDGKLFEHVQKITKVST